jgi:Na+/proline symporter
VVISKKLNLDHASLLETISESKYSRMFYFQDFKGPNYFFKQFLSGAFITIVMTGLDQDMMQKNLSCRSLGGAQKNMLTYSVAFVPVNLLFLSLGALLYIYASAYNISLPAASDDVFPFLATQGYLPVSVGVLFILGLIAAAYSSADSALTSLTTSVTVDIIGIKNKPEHVVKQLRMTAHVAMSVLLFLVIMAFAALRNENVITTLFKAAGYTYGPLLGLFMLGLFTRINIKGRYVPVVAVVSPALCYVLNIFSETWFNGYQFGFEILLLNGFLTVAGLLLLRTSK